MTDHRRKATAAADMDAARVMWRTSSYSGGSGNCVEVAVARMESGVGIRDSKAPDGPVLAVAHQAWREFEARVKNGDPGLPG